MKMIRYNECYHLFLMSLSEALLLHKLHILLKAELNAIRRLLSIIMEQRMRLFVACCRLNVKFPAKCMFLNFHFD